MTISWRSALPEMLAVRLPDPTASGVCWQADERTFLLEIPDIARFRVKDGEVAYASLGDLDDRAIRMFGAGLPAAAAWIQQGYFTLHASAVATPSGAVLFAGSSAVGKSAVAAALAQRGYPVLADEVAPLNLSASGPLTLVASPDAPLLLWRDVMKELGMDAEKYTPLRPGLPRYVVDGLGIPNPAPSSYAVRSIYLLGTRNDPGILLTQIDGGRSVLAVMENAFNRYLPQPSHLRQRTFVELTAQLAKTPVYRLMRPNAKRPIGPLVDRIAGEIAL
ncbi:MAG: hypothetical protein KDD92_17755 [Caldilineaceae bacterium]|nr:hypothetical protein [Caldilineaceae bacterium]